MSQKESHIRSLLKGISWRIVASSTTVALIVLSVVVFAGYDLDQAIKIGLKAGVLEFFIKLAIYYVYERVWQNRVGYHGHTKRTILFKSIIWRILASLAGLAIVYFSVENGNEEEGINSVLPYTIYLLYMISDFIAKFCLFYLHEVIWHNLPHGRIRAFLRRAFRKE